MLLRPPLERSPFDADRSFTKSRKTKCIHGKVRGTKFPVLVYVFV